MDFKSQLQTARLLPIITLKSEKQISIIKKVIENSDIEMVEVAFRSELAAKAIEEFSTLDNVSIGAGTVKTLEQAKIAIEAGSKFLVSPGYNPEVVKYASEKNIPITPGVLTPTEILKGMNEADISIFKIFPANIIGGLSAIKALSGPFYDVDFLPTGGVNKDNFIEFLQEPQIICVGGSFIINDSINESEITSEIEKINDLVSKAKAVKK
ncbi:bifunctional 4-hydroxy-2-oxoglutarate aldolase/2-dehydro-3-deoxy-phosphogluconate aldolase [Enterococcus avium]|uniref:bifunctional 4-hydroxy-2-oxoglutarate aldolase/2-dehydro-3-deoxy-phosphogluconate aldolase n=1 Tax=Enterococcus avium TaxID=33945 RepID=UPI0023300AB4|nr:bifunctional 4-hydroxy-2-oxoglutarate aldolase/2-dehydro-3-deoxy-phosphogluconate aldolase [Enterococcus avium]MDB1729466.1 bifunctional 4-hydroxy-2-oxoglutarate aldolase/2-dehydro-3-deoxy-phosphogluconate aldolase [Enterococcus avium]MDB1733542.1 bifunctional 4-hydroxy-2-oxoglutarate aldolase/2-dehydro-3-deoxy-phosphogluconate aldolase [Enterococcus avium]